MKKILGYIAVLILGGIIGYLICSRSANEKIQKRWEKAQAVERAIQTKIDSIQGLNKDLSLANDYLEGKIYQDSIDSSLERLKIIPERKTVIDENFVLDKGKELYGGSHLENTRRANVASYGKQGISEVIDLRKISSNQKAVIVNCESIVQFKDTIILNYKSGLKFAAKKAKNDFKTGVFVGGGGVLLIVLGILLL